VPKEPVILMKSDFCDLYKNFDKFIDSNDQNVKNYLKDFIKKWENGDGKKIAKDKKLDLTKPEIFCIIRIKSNEYMPRFQFAYDSDEFTKEEIVYLIHTIFNPQKSEDN
jgi:hypothetical protein